MGKHTYHVIFERHFNEIEESVLSKDVNNHHLFPLLERRMWRMLDIQTNFQPIKPNSPKQISYLHLIYSYEVACPPFIFLLTTPAIMVALIQVASRGQDTYTM